MSPCILTLYTTCLRQESALELQWSYELCVLVRDTVHRLHVPSGRWWDHSFHWQLVRFMLCLCDRRGFKIKISKYPSDTQVYKNSTTSSPNVRLKWFLRQLSELIARGGKSSQILHLSISTAWLPQSKSFALQVKVKFKFNKADVCL